MSGFGASGVGVASIEVEGIYQPRSASFTSRVEISSPGIALPRFVETLATIEASR